MTISAANLNIADTCLKLKRQEQATKEYLIRQIVFMKQPTCDASIAVSTIAHFSSVIALFRAWATTPGLTAFAGDQSNEVLLIQMESVRDQLIAMFPKDSNGFLLYQSFDAIGRVQMRTFTAAQLTPVVILLNDVIAAIS